MATDERQANGVKTFFGEVGAEMRKTSWPTRQELVQQTIIVIVSVLLVGFFVAICDNVLVALLKQIIPAAR